MNRPACGRAWRRPGLIEQFRQDVRRDGGDHAQPQAAAQRRRLGFAGSHQVVHRQQDGLRLAADILAQGRHHHLLVVALHQPGAKLAFQLLNTGAQGGLGDVTGLGGMAEMTVLGYRTQVLELLQARQVHHRKIRSG